jgi:hypothetical protein
MGLDSVELLMEIEKEFSIRVEDREAEMVRTVQDLYDLVWMTIQRKARNHNESASISKNIAFSRTRELISISTGIELDKILPHHNLKKDLNLD